MALERDRRLELVRGLVRREALEDGLVEAARRLRAVRLEAVLRCDLLSDKQAAAVAGTTAAHDATETRAPRRNARRNIVE